MKKELVKSEYVDDKLSYKNLINGNIPPYVMRFIKAVGKTVNTFDMIRADENVLLAVSGGKDSLSLALALSLRRKWLPVSYNLKALMIDWEEHPIEEAYKPRLKEFFSDLDIDFSIINQNQFSSGFDGDFNCYLCSRNRRRILFEKAMSDNFKIVAMGHHLDDLVETTMMNLFFRSDFSSMNPIQEFFNGKLYIIRPLINIHESQIKRLVDAYDFPVVKPVCPYDAVNIRANLKPIIRELSHLDNLVREHVFNAHDFSNCKIIRD